MTLKSLAGLTLCWLLLCCQPPAANNSSLKGVWASEGYSKTLIINHDHYQLTDNYQEFCTPGFKGALTALTPYLLLEKDTLKLFKGTSVYAFIRPAEDSVACNEIRAMTPDKDVLLNFNAFTQTVKKHYAFQSAMKEDLDSTIALEYHKLTKNLTERQLYLSLDHILATMNDNHGYIEATEDVYSNPEPTVDTLSTATISAESDLPELGDFQVADQVAETYFQKEYTKGTTLMRWGLINDTVGYIQVKAMWLLADLQLDENLVEKTGYVNAYVRQMDNLPESVYIEEERKGASVLMDQIMKDLDSTLCILIDVRFNGGGQDVVSKEILQRFNAEKLAVATKKAYVNGDFTDQQTLYLPPAKQPYTKPVFLLTSRQTASAADFIALASLPLAHFIRMGTNTQGALSDALEKRMPNGWYFSLSNELYYDMEGNNYEYRGVPPDITLDYPEDRQEFFRMIMNNTLFDKKMILDHVGAHLGDQKKTQ